MSRIGLVLMGLTLLGLTVLNNPVHASQIHHIELEDIVSGSQVAAVICEVIAVETDSTDQTSTSMTVTLRIVRLLNPSQVETGTFQAESVLRSYYEEPTGIWIDDDGNVGVESPIIPGSGLELTVDIGVEYIFLLDRLGYGLIRVEPMTNLETVEALFNPPTPDETTPGDPTTE